MRTSQRSRYTERIERVVQHLERQAQDSDAPSLEQLADVAAMSPFHFHRVFRLMTGETVAQMVRRVRLARSLPGLAEARTVTDSALDSGYSSPQAFARAMKRQAGLSPSDARDDEERLAALSAQLRGPVRSETATPLSVEVVSLEPFRLLAIRNVGDYAELNRGFTRLFDLVLEQVSPESLLGIYGIPYDDPRFVPADECRFDCALAVGDQGSATEELRTLTLGQGTFAKLRHLGDYDEIYNTIDTLYLDVMDRSELEIGSGPLFIHYLDDPEEVAAEDLRSDVYLPLS